MANAPRCSVGPRTANSAAAKKAARRPYSRLVAPHSSAVAPEHEDQGQDPGRGQAPDAVRQRAERRVDDRSPGEVGRERRDRRAVQPVRPLQVPGPQVGGLILERRVGPDEPERKSRLNDEHRDQRPPARGIPPEHSPFARATSGGSRGAVSSAESEASVAWRVVVPCSIGRTCLRSGACQGRLGSPPAAHLLYWRHHTPWRYPPGQEYPIREGTGGSWPRKDVCRIFCYAEPQRDVPAAPPGQGRTCW